jgi:hypothetical protein
MGSEPALPGSTPVERMVGRAYPESPRKRRRRVAAEHEERGVYAATLDSLFVDGYIGRRRRGSISGTRLA